MDLCLRPHLEISTCNCFFRIKSKSAFRIKGLVPGDGASVSFIGFWISDLWLEISFTTESTTESSSIKRKLANNLQDGVDKKWQKLWQL